MCEFIVRQFYGIKKRSFFFVRSFCWEKISKNETNKKLIFFNLTELNFTVEEIERHFWEYFFAFMLTVIMRWIGILLLWFQMNYIIPEQYLIFAFFWKKILPKGKETERRKIHLFCYIRNSHIKTWGSHHAKSFKKLIIMDRLNSVGEIIKQFLQETYFKNWKKI